VAQGKEGAVNSERELILSRVRAALAPLGRRAPLPDWGPGLLRRRDARPGADPWQLFSERLRAVNGTPLAAPAELAALLAKNSWFYGYCDPQLWPLLAESLPSPFCVETTHSRDNLLRYDFGITAAFGAIAETGTLILTDRGTSSRLAALAPWVHVAVLGRSTILPDIPAALEVQPPDPNIVWVTGPSKTADVEGIMIEGVHGPGVQVALLRPGDS
jgi:L-lactate dehydrogenase complex protein LldG